MTNCPQRRFEPFVRWQIARRDVLSRLSDDKLFPETFWAFCQMTNCPQRRFEPFVRWQIVPRDVLSHLSDDKSSPEAFWDERPLHFKKNDDLSASPFWSFCLKGYFYGLPRFARNDGYEVTGLPRFARNDGYEVTGLSCWRSQWRVWGHWIATLTLAMMGMRSLDCHADARNDGCEVTGLSRWRSQWRVWGHWIATLTLAMMGLVHEFTKVFSPARG